MKSKMELNLKRRAPSSFLRCLEEIKPMLPQLRVVNLLPLLQQRENRLQQVRVLPTLIKMKLLRKLNPRLIKRRWLKLNRSNAQKLKLTHAASTPISFSGSNSRQ